MYVSTRFSLSMEMSKLMRDGTAEPVSRDQILRRERGQGNIHFPCSADNVQDWQPYRVGPYSWYMCNRTYMHVMVVAYFQQYNVGQKPICILYTYINLHAGTPNNQRQKDTR